MPSVVNAFLNLSWSRLLSVCGEVCSLQRTLQTAGKDQCSPSTLLRDLTWKGREDQVSIKTNHLSPVLIRSFCLELWPEASFVLEDEHACGYNWGHFMLLITHCSGNDWTKDKDLLVYLTYSMHHLCLLIPALPIWGMFGQKADLWSEMAYGSNSHVALYWRNKFLWCKSEGLCISLFRLFMLYCINPFWYVLVFSQTLWANEPDCLNPAVWKATVLRVARKISSYLISH